MRFQTLFELFPTARFVLTERPYESWVASLRHYFEYRYGVSDFAELRTRGSDRKQPLFANSVTWRSSTQPCAVSALNSACRLRRLPSAR